MTKALEDPGIRLDYSKNLPRICRRYLDRSYSTIVRSIIRRPKMDTDGDKRGSKHEFCIEEGACLIYVICVCLCIVVSSTYCFVFLPLVYPMLLVFLDCPF